MALAAMPTVRLPSGKQVSALGQGTWEMGDDPSKHQEEIQALRTGVDLGMTLIDTAEIYGDGAAERLIAEALGDRRQELYLVSKVFPGHATLQGTIEACEKSLRRLKTDHLDLYLLHWPGSIPLSETFEAFQRLKSSGKILDFGVSNFDLHGMQQAAEVVDVTEIATNQVLYNLMRRGIEYDLLPWCEKYKIPIMAYSPVERGILVDHPILQQMAMKKKITPAQLALAWVLRNKQIIVIPKASRVEHVIENRAALDVHLSHEDLKALDEAFSPPKRKSPLDVI